ncbi:MAG: autotransporter outer membrane beta-barrel domain-containing protein [Puniceicoccales bacterium]|jgi:hypothetical protein|nr:autotransporter outer membrane beta-barrel domain-containing protein [Puniceicoccales bacterium]
MTTNAVRRPAGCPVRRLLRAAAAPLSAIATLALCAATLHARPHNGLSNGGAGDGFTDLYAAWGVALGEYPDARVNNASNLAFGSLATLPALTAAGDVSALLRHLDKPHFLGDAAGTHREIDAYYGPRTGSLDGRHPALRGEWEPFVFGQWNFSDFDRDPARPTYNAETWGAGVGVTRWVDDERLIGVALSRNLMRARLHDGGGHIDGDNARLHAFAALIPEAQPWWVAFGASGGYLAYTTKRFRSELFSDTTGDDGVTPLSKQVRGTPQGYEYGVFGAFNIRLRLAEGLTFTPFARIDFNRAEIGEFMEHGDGWTLRTRRFHGDSVQTRLGAGIEWQGRLDALAPRHLPAAFVRAGCTVAWASELIGDRIKIRSAYEWDSGGDPATAAARPLAPDGSFDILDGNGYTTRAGQLFGDALEVSPTIAIVFSNGLTLQAAWDLRVTIDAQFMQSFSGSVSWRF